MSSCYDKMINVYLWDNNFLSRPHFAKEMSLPRLAGSVNCKKKTSYKDKTRFITLTLMSLDSSLFFIKGFLQLLLHHFKQLSEKLDDLRVNRIAYSYCNFYHRPECLTLRSRKSFPAQHDWLPSNTCKRYCPGYISDMPARKTSMTTPN